MQISECESQFSSFKRIFVKVKFNIEYGISHDRGGHLFPFLHKNWNLKYKTWLGAHTFFYMDSRVKIYSINND